MSTGLLQFDILNRTPDVFIEFNASRANSSIIISKQLVVLGQKFGGTAALNSVNIITRIDDAKTLFGVGSQIVDMLQFLIANNRTIEVKAIPVLEGGVAATKEITVTGTATSNQAIFVFVASRVVQVVVNIGDTPTVIAASIATQINLNTDMLVAASSVAGLVTLTANNKGLWTEKIPIAVNPFTPARGGTQKDPEGVTFVTGTGIAGSGNPDISAALAALPDEVFDYILQPYNDDLNLDILETELEDRQDANVQLEGHSFNAFSGDVTASTVYGGLRNSEFSTTLHAGVASLSIEHQWASAYAGRASRISTLDPAVPWQFEPLVGIEKEAEITKHANKLHILQFNLQKEMS